MSVQYLENGSPSGGWTSWRPMICAMLAVGLIAEGLPAFGRSTLYDETRVLQAFSAACGGAVNCKIFESGAYKLDAGQNQTLTFQCPDQLPYFAGWDAEHNEHIRATKLSHAPGETSGDGVPTGPDRRLVILAENVGKGGGYISVLLGCSTEATLATSVMHQSSGVPLNAMSFHPGKPK